MVVTEGSSAYAVKARAQTIHREYGRKAKAADTKYNSTLPGVQGPIAAKLASFGKVQVGLANVALPWSTCCRAPQSLVPNVPFHIGRRAQQGVFR